MYTAVLFTIATMGKQPKRPSTDGERKCGKRIQWDVVLCKVGNPALCDSRNEPGTCFLKVGTNDH